MKSSNECLSSPNERSLPSPAESAFAGEEVEIPAQLLIPVNLGLLVFPAFGYAKHAATIAGTETATCDLAQIGSWIRLYRGHPLNWHLATGPVAGNGVVALEVNGDHGRTALCQLCEDDWDWIDTLRSQSGDGSRYLFFRWPAGMAMRRSSKQLAPGLILHGEGDSVPLPPSRTRAGIVHAYLTPRAALAYPPEWLVKAAFQVVETGAGSRIDSISDWDNSSAA